MKLKKGKTYRNIAENYHELPFGEPIKLTGIMTYNDIEFAYFEELKKVLPVKKIEEILEESDKKIETNIVTSVINKIYREVDKKGRHICSFYTDPKRLKEAVLNQQEKWINKTGKIIDDCSDNDFDWIDIMYQNLGNLLLLSERMKRSKNENSIDK